MGKIIFELDENLEKYFRIALTYLKGSEKGVLKVALEEAVLLWLDAKKSELPPELSHLVTQAIKDHKATKFRETYLHPIGTGKVVATGTTKKKLPKNLKSAIKSHEEQTNNIQNIKGIKIPKSK